MPVDRGTERRDKIKRGDRRMRLLLLLCLMAVPPTVSAQESFTLTVKSPKTFGKSVTLTVYDGETTAHKYVQRVKEGTVTFSAPISKPSAAQLAFAGKRQLYLYLEGSEMNLEVNGDDLEHSPLSGSRSNSQYRYAMETASDPKSLADYLRSNRTSPIAAFVLYRQMRSMEPTKLEQLYGVLDSVEASCYHYHAIGKYLTETKALSEGMPLPDFEFTEGGQKCRLTECLFSGQPSVVFFGATWCDICVRDIAVAEKICVDSVTLVTVDIDADRRGWDSPYLEKLDIAHLPYIIVLDREGKIAARDVRIWELKRTLDPLKKR